MTDLFVPFTVSEMKILCALLWKLGFKEDLEKIDALLAIAKPNDVLGITSQGDWALMRDEAIISVEIV